MNTMQTIAWEVEIEIRTNIGITEEWKKMINWQESKNQKKGIWTDEEESEKEEKKRNKGTPMMMADGDLWGLAVDQVGVGKNRSTTVADGDLRGLVAEKSCI